MEEFRELHFDAYAENHPAGYDQQVEEAKELIGKAKAWLLVAMIEPDEGTPDEIHSAIAKKPGVSTREFGLIAVQAAVTTLGKAVEKEDEFADEED